MVLFAPAVVNTFWLARAAVFKDVSPAATPEAKDVVGAEPATAIDVDADKATVPKVVTAVPEVAPVMPPAVEAPVVVWVYTIVLPSAACNSSAPPAACESAVTPVWDDTLLIAD